MATEILLDTQFVEVLSALVGLTTSVNCCVLPSVIVAVSGETVTLVTGIAEFSMITKNWFVLGFRISSTFQMASEQLLYQLGCLRQYQSAVYMN